MRAIRPCDGLMDFKYFKESNGIPLSYIFKKKRYFRAVSHLTYSYPYPLRPQSTHWGFLFLSNLSKRLDKLYGYAIMYILSKINIPVHLKNICSQDQFPNLREVAPASQWLTKWVRKWERIKGECPFLPVPKGRFGRKDNRLKREEIRPSQPFGYLETLWYASSLLLKEILIKDFSEKNFLFTEKDSNIIQ